MFSLALVSNGVTFLADSDTGCCLCWSRCPLSVVSDSGRYFEKSFSVSPGHVAKDPYFIACIRVR